MNVQESASSAGNLALNRTLSDDAIRSRRRISLSSFGGEGWGEEAPKKLAHSGSVPHKAMFYQSPEVASKTASSLRPSPPEEEREHHAALATFNVRDSLCRLLQFAAPVLGLALPLLCPAQVPTITALSPTVGRAGSSVLISGANFSPAASSNIVFFGATRAPVQVASPTNLLVTIPVGATYGPITVTANGLTACAQAPFLPTFPGTNAAIDTSAFAARVDLPSDPCGRVLIADLDGDGKPDLVVSTAHAIAVYRNISTNNGPLDTSAFAPRISLPVRGGSGDVARLAVADLDGDGRLDLLVTDRAVNQVAIYQNLCTSGVINSNSFAGPLTVTVGADPRDLAVADLDGDGRPDIVTGNYAAGTISLVRNLCSPGLLTTNSFAPAFNLATGAGAYAVAIGDLDGDGQPDLAVVNFDATFLSLFRNLGAGSPLSASSFAPRVDLPAMTGCGMITLADLDGDGKNDLVFCSSISDTISVYHNVASPGTLTTNSFEPRIDFGTGAWSHTIAVGDFNGDGKPDLAVVTELPSQLLVYQNQATPGSFTAASLRSPVLFGTGWNAWGVSAGDLDGDGRPDIVFVNTYDATVSIYRNVMAVAQPPALIVQPASQFVALGGNASFAATALGAPPLVYQWFFNDAPLTDGGRISGASTASLTITGAQTNDMGDYWLLVTNALGAATSLVAHLTVVLPPAILAQPQDQSLPAGANATFTVLASSTEPLTYQWFFNGILLTDNARYSGASTATLLISNIQLPDTGTFTVTVSNPAGSVTSAGAVLTVLQAPVFGSQPAGCSVPLGFPASFSVTVSGTAPLNCQWQLNGVDIPGATNTTYAITAATTNDLGLYHVTVTNPVGTATSSDALLTLGTLAAWGRNDFGQVLAPPGLTNIIMTAAGTAHTLALLADGTVVAWGGNQYGQTSVPPGLSNIVSVAAGGDHSLALRSDGTVAAWGNNNFSQATVPGTLSNVVAIAAGALHSLALRSDGTVVMWGYATTVPAGLRKVVAIAAGGYNSMALLNGTVVVWSNNNLERTNVPAGLNDVTAIAAGYYHFLALRSNGTVVAWSSTYGPTNVPPSLTNVVAIASGDSHCLALRSDGTLAAWGQNSYGQTSLSPALSNVVAIAAGGSHNLALIGDGRPLLLRPPVGGTGYIGRSLLLRARAAGAAPLSYQWQHNGSNIDGATDASLLLPNLALTDAGSYQLLVTNALGAVTSLPVPVTVLDGIAPFLLGNLPANQTSYLGSRTVLGVTVGGSGPLQFQWKYLGQINVPGATNDELVFDPAFVTNSGPYLVTISNPFGSVSSTMVNLYVVPIKVWGYTPTDPPASANNVVAVAAGLTSYLALRSDGKVVAWGSSEYGPLTPPTWLSNVVAISVGSDHRLALRADGTVVAWGSNIYGQTNGAAAQYNIIAISAGSSHDLALRSDGTVAAWGSASQYNLTTVPTNAVNIVAIAAGYDHNLVLRSDGKIIGWGNNIYNIATPPAWLSNVVAIAAGLDHNLALRADGTVAAWGLGSATNVPAGLSNVVAIAAGAAHSTALRSDGTVVVWGDYGAPAAYLPASAPADLANVIQIASGGDHTMALFGNRSPVFTLQPFSRTVFPGTNLVLVGKVAGAPPLRYQWQFKGADIPGATTDTLALTNVQFAQAGAYRLVVSNAYGAATSVNAKLAVTLPLGQAVNATNLAWTSTGSAPWFGQTAVTHDGVDAARSGAINDSQESILQTTIIGPGRLTWWWKVSSEPWFDTLEFRLGGVAQAVISGEVDWEQRGVIVPSGTQTLQWRYSKDLTSSGGQDAGWVDQVVFIPDPPAVTRQPAGGMVNVGASIFLSVTATGSPPLAYQWLKDGTNIVGANGSTLFLPSATRRNTGTYSVRVSNPGGAILSSNAFFKVLVPQRLGLPAPQPDGSLLLTSTDADSGLLLPDDLLGLTAQASTNLVDWISLPGALSLTNGILLIRDPDATNYSRRFYRVSETITQIP